MYDWTTATAIIISWGIVIAMIFSASRRGKKDVGFALGLFALFAVPAILGAIF